MFKPDALGELYSLPYDISVVLEWRGVDRFDSSKRIHGVKKHYNNLRWSLWAAVQETDGSQMALEDASSGAVHETYGQPSVWFGPWPGQPPSILPRPIFASSGVPANPSP